MIYKNSTQQPCSSVVAATARVAAVKTATLQSFAIAAPYPLEQIAMLSTEFGRIVSKQLMIVVS